MIPSLEFSMSSSAEAKSGLRDNRQDQTYSGGDAGGQRGFVNNFAGGGSKLSASDGINGPALSPGAWAWLLPLAALGVLVFFIWKRTH